MPDFAAVLESLYSGGDVTIFQATVDEVGQGVVTIHANGGSFTDVPLVQGIDGPTGSVLGVGDPVYVIGRKGWGMLVFARPEPGPDRGGSDPQVATWPARARARWNSTTGAWTVPSADTMRLVNPGENADAAVFFYNLADVVMPAGSLATASVHVSFSSIDQSSSDMAVDWAYWQVGLVTNTGPTGAFAPLANLAVNGRVSQAGGTADIPLPLDWASRLLAGSASGISVRSIDFPMTVGDSGTIRITTLG